MTTDNYEPIHLPPGRGDNAWDRIFRSQGRVFDELYPAYYELLAHFQARAVRRVLDLGCGSGRHTVALSQAGFTVTGLDLAPAGLSLTCQWLREERLDAHLLQADFRRPFPLPANHFDGLISTQVIHHARLAGVQNAIAEIWRVLAPSGLAFVSVAGALHDKERYQQVEPGTFVPLDGDEAGLPHHIFSLHEYSDALQAFTILDLGYRAEGRVLVALVEKPAAVQAALV